MKYQINKVLFIRTCKQCLANQKKKAIRLIKAVLQS